MGHKIKVFSKPRLGASAGIGLKWQDRQNEPRKQDLDELGLVLAFCFLTSVRLRDGGGFVRRPLGV